MYIIPSPIACDTILVKDPDNPMKTIRVGKLLRQVSISELHNDLVSKGKTGLPEVWDKNDNLLVSDTSFRSLIPPHIKYMTTKYKQMCGCEICVMIKSLQNDLNQYRLSTIHRLEKTCIDKEGLKIYR